MLYYQCKIKKNQKKGSNKMELMTDVFVFTLKEFCASMDDIEALVDEEEEDEDYWDDDVDETNYDPYLGCDFYDTGDCSDW